MAGFIPGYSLTLTSEASKRRYNEKLKLLDGIDPYEVDKKEWQDDLDLWPAITHVHACMYLILSPSPYTENDILNYKSLDSYQNFVKGWVRQVLVKAIADKRIVIGKVNHSQKMSEKPLTPWVISMKDGKILGAHCDCMAGLGESCSHVSSLLWLVAVGVEKRDALTVTQKSAYWVMPPAVRSAPYLPIKEIDFIGKKKKASSMTINEKEAASAPKRRKFDTPTLEEEKLFLDSLASMERARPAVLSVLPGYADKYIPSALSLDLPQLLTDLYKPSHLKMSYFELLQLSSKVVVSITDEQRKTVELNTRDQSKGKLWFRMRAGRITASKVKAVCHTDPSSPSLSLVMSICHPDTVRFKTAATLWGCQHEKDALKQYETTSRHHGLTLSPAGFFISGDHPYFGASPDSMVSCFCCGPGICEVKCPFCHKNDYLDEAANDTNFCLQKDIDGQLKLKTSHQYYYQVQAQLFCTGLSYCDFVVYTKNQLHVERITPDTLFMKEIMIKVQHFFEIAVLPELLGRWFSRLPSSSTNTTSLDTSTSLPEMSTSSSDLQNKYCYCQQEEYGDMVGCDNNGCPYQWFHLSCLKLNSLPKSSKWYCPDCRKLQKK